MGGSGTAVHLILALLIAAPLVFAGITKLLGPTRFAAAIPSFGLGFVPASPSAARLVGLVEFTQGAVLFLVPSHTTALTTTLLYLLLGWLMWRAVRRGASGDCGCFGAIPGRIDRWSVVRNVILAVAAAGLVSGRYGQHLERYELAVAAPLLIAITVGFALTDTVIEVRRTFT